MAHEDAAKRAIRARTVACGASGGERRSRPAVQQSRGVRSRGAEQRLAGRVEEPRLEAGGRSGSGGFIDDPGEKRISLAEPLGRDDREPAASVETVAPSDRRAWSGERREEEGGKNSSVTRRACMG